MKYHDYYQTLGVGRTATTEEIHKAYRKLARKFHPDISKEKDAEARFKEIVEAYEVLKDDDKRKRYDTLGANWKAGQDFQPPPGFGGVRFEFHGDPDGSFEDMGGFSDFFQNLFGGLGGGPRGGGAAGGGAGGGFASSFRRRGRGRGHAEPAARGSTHELDLEVTIEEAWRGASKRFDVAVRETLPSGEARQTTRSYDVRIPPGTTEGKKIRLAGQGGPGSGGGEAGDIILRVRFAPHPRFRVEGHDLVVTVPITPWEAALGAKVPVETLDGAVDLAVPPGTASGQRLRLRDQGLPKGGGERGHLLVELKIAVPRELTKEERRLFEELARTSRFDPRGA